MISFRQIIACWNRFFFEPIAPNAIAIYRIVLGCLMTANLLLMIPDVGAWFSDRGTVSIATARTVSGGSGFVILPYLPHTDGWVWAYFIVLLLFSVTFTLGFWTRTSAIVVFLLFVGLHHRNPVILNSGDSFMRIAMFFMIFAPAGAVYSLDRWWRVRKGREKGVPKPTEPWAQRLIQLQLAFLYFYAFVWKAMGPMWLEGTAVYYTSRLVEFWRFPVPYVYEHMWSIKLWSWGTLVVEFALGVLVWVKELRYWVLLSGVLLHLGIDYSMNIPLFGPIMVAAYITFVEPDHLQKCLAWCKGLRSKPARQPGTINSRPVTGNVASVEK